MNPHNYNFDYMVQNANSPVFSLPDSGDNYWLNPTLFDLRYSNYPKDVFFGILPNAQNGDTATVDVTITGQTGSSGTLPAHNVHAAGLNVYTGLTTRDEQGTSLAGNAIRRVTTTAFPASAVLNVDGYTGQQIADKLDASLNILNLRKGNFLQKYKEIIGSGSQDYQNIIKKIFGVDISDTLADHCTYLGGDSSQINISEVINNNLTGDSQANIQGKGIGSSNGNFINFQSQEHGIIMCIYHAMPIVDYSLNALNFDVTKTEVDDFANPVFDKLGFQELPNIYFDNKVDLRDDRTDYLGYTSRYFDYKTAVDNVLGDFRETIPQWIAPVTSDVITAMYANTGIGMNFFQVDPRILDPIFAVGSNASVTTDQLRISAQFTVNAVRNLDYNGLPY